MYNEKIDKAVNTYLESIDNIGWYGFNLPAPISWIFIACFVGVFLTLTWEIICKLLNSEKTSFSARLNGVKLAFLPWGVVLVIASFLTFYTLESNKRYDIYLESNEAMHVLIREDIKNNYITQEKYLKEAIRPTNFTIPSTKKESGLYRVSFMYNNEQYTDKLVYFTYNDSVESGVLIPFKAEESYKEILDLTSVYNLDANGTRTITSMETYHFNNSNTLDEIDYIYNIKIN